MGFQRYYLVLLVEDAGASYTGGKKIQINVTAKSEHDARRHAVQTALAQRLWVREIEVKRVRKV